MTMMPFTPRGKSSAPATRGANMRAPSAAIESMLLARISWASGTSRLTEALKAGS